MALVQKKSAVTNNDQLSITVILDAAPTQNNTLVVCVNSGSTITTLTGYSLAFSAVNWIALYEYYKVAVAAELATITVTFNGPASGEITVFEYSGMLTTGVLDKTATNNSGAAALGSFSTGTTATTAQADEEAVAAVGRYNEPTNTVTAWSNSFVEESDLNSTGTGTLSALGTASKTLAATGTVESTATFSANTNQTPGAGVGTYKKSAAAASLVASPRARRLGALLQL
jgi:hypothetical protein